MCTEKIRTQCGRLIGNAIVYYNAAILSRLRERLEAEGNDRGADPDIAGGLAAHFAERTLYLPEQQ